MEMVTKMISVSIVKVTSYAGLELLRLLAQHPQFSLVSITARSTLGKRLDEIFPHLSNKLNFKNKMQAGIDPGLIITEEPGQSELAFVCLPHAAAALSVLTLLERGIRVVDLSADFRLHDATVYAEWYKHTHPVPALLETAVYGLCERYQEQIEGAALVANPGCYATAAILGLLPAVAAGIIWSDVIIDAKSGVSGAGRSLTMGTHYAEANEDVSAYSLTSHRHLPEIMQELEAAALEAEHSTGQPLRITFIPMTRGILATCYAELSQAARQCVSIETEVRSLDAEYYAGEPFVRVLDQPPHTKWTYGAMLLYLSHGRCTYQTTAGSFLP
jgi:N-acetyl-gamma-glutamyl-phosphate reductase